MLLFLSGIIYIEWTTNSLLKNSKLLVILISKNTTEKHWNTGFRKYFYYRLWNIIWIDITFSGRFSLT